MKDPRQLLFSLVRRTPRRTFVLFPLIALVSQLTDLLNFAPYNFFALILLPVGFSLYKVCGFYIKRNGEGGPNPSRPPTKLVTTGPYRYVRNPMYLGHIIFLIGVALALSSYVAVFLLLIQVAWLRKNTIEDEALLTERYGSEYLRYKESVSKWIPWPAKRRVS